VIVDNDGRLFGRINLIDAAIGGFLVLLLPVAYASYLLFRPPAPQITSVEPAQLTMIEERAAQGTELAGKLKVRGSGLRPVLRAKIGDTDAVAFIFETPSSADVLFGAVPAGTHDLVLYDGIQEVARAPRAVSVPEKPGPGAMWIALSGRFVDLDHGAASSLKPGGVYPPEGERVTEIFALGPIQPATIPVTVGTEASIEGRHQRTALIAVRCTVVPAEPRDCAFNGVRMGPNVLFAVPAMPPVFRFLVDAVLPVTPPVPARLRVRLFGVPEAVALVRVDDVDSPQRAIDQRGGIIREIGARRDGPGDLSVLLSQEGATAVASVARADTIGSVDVTIAAGLDRHRSGWRYRGDSIRASGPFTFTTPAYALRGLILRIDVDESVSRATQ
jgi:hypothetical protein